MALSIKLIDKINIRIKKYIIKAIKNTPEFEEISSIYEAISKAKADMMDKNIECNYLMLISPSLKNCNIEVTPKVDNKIILSKVDFQSILSLHGHTTISGTTTITGKSEAVKLFTGNPL